MGDFVRCVPKVAPPPWELRAGVVGPFGAVNGPVGVGVIARVEAAMLCLAAMICVFSIASACLSVS